MISKWLIVLIISTDIMLVITAIIGLKMASKRGMRLNKMEPYITLWRKYTDTLNIIDTSDWFKRYLENDKIKKVVLWGGCDEHDGLMETFIKTLQDASIEIIYGLAWNSEKNKSSINFLSSNEWDKAGKEADLIIFMPFLYPGDSIHERIFDYRNRKIREIERQRYFLEAYHDKYILFSDILTEVVSFYWKEKESVEKKEQIIPKKIHYIWFGDPNKMPKKSKEYIEGWKQKNPYYEVLLWNEENYDVNAHSYTKAMYSKEKYAFVSDYARLDILYHEGGIYLDIDIELLKSLDSVIENEAFFIASNEAGWINSGLGIGCVPKQSDVGKLLHMYDFLSLYSEDNEINTLITGGITNAYFKHKLGYKPSLDLKQWGGITVYPNEWIINVSNYADDIQVTDNTVGIHRSMGSWVTDKYTRRWTKIYEVCRKIFGETIATIICYFVLKIPRELS